MVLLFDQFNLSENIYSIIFATEHQQIVGKMLIKFIQENGGEIGKTEMGLFASQLHVGETVERERGKSPLDREDKISYNKRQFYDRILTPMRGMGLIEYDLYKKTYKISDKFNKLMIRIGLMWLREIENKRY